MPPGVALLALAAALLSWGNAWAADELSPGSIGIAWHRCPGTPGSAVNLQLDTRSPKLQDTLVVAWDPGGDTWDDYIACLGEVRFHDAVGDSVAPFWQFGGRGRNKLGLVMNLHSLPDSSDCPSVWRNDPDGGSQYDLAYNYGKLRFTFYVAITQGYPIKGGAPYHAANIYLRHDKADSLAGAMRPMIVEFVSWRGHFGATYSKEYTQGERRFASINDPTGKYMREFLARRGTHEIKPWAPKSP